MSNFGKTISSIASCVLIGLGAYLAYWLIQQPDAPQPVLTEETAIGVTFETNKSNIDIVYIELTDVILAEPLENVRFVQSDTEPKLLVQGHGESDTLFDVKMSHTLIIPSAQTKKISERYAEAFGKSIELTDAVSEE